jgi:hypothetical protein
VWYSQSSQEGGDYEQNIVIKQLETVMAWLRQGGGRELQIYRSQARAEELR